MENIISELNAIQVEVKKIHRQFTQITLKRRTKAVIEEKLNNLDKLHSEYKKLTEEINLQKETEINKALNELRKTYYNTYNTIFNYSHDSNDNGIAYLKNVVLQHLGTTLDENEFDELQKAYLNESYGEKTDAEGVVELLENLLSYYSKSKAKLHEENEQLLQHINLLRQLNDSIQTDSENQDTETNELEERFKQLEIEKNKLVEKLKKLELQKENDSDLGTTHRDTEKALLILLQENKTTYEKALAILQAENTTLRKQISELGRKSHIKLNKIEIKMTNLEGISKQVNNIVPIFMGSRSQDVISDLNIFLYTSKMLHDTLTVEGQKILLEYLITRCRGDAYELLIKIKIEKLEDIETALKNKYYPIKDYRDFKDDLTKCSQRIGETLTEYSDRLKTTLWGCISCVESKFGNKHDVLRKTLEMEAVDIFVSGITNDSVRRYLLTIKCDGLEKTIEEAIYFERADSRYQKQASSVQIHHVAQAQDQQDVTQLLQLLNSRYTEQASEQLLGGPESSDRQLIYAVRTWMSNKSRPGNAYQQTRGNTNGFQNPQMPIQVNGVSCDFCKKSGHTEDVCMRKHGICFKCRQGKHFSRDCPNTSTGQQQPQQSAQYWQQNQQQYQQQFQQPYQQQYQQPYQQQYQQPYQQPHQQQQQQGSQNWPQQQRSGQISSVSCLFCRRRGHEVSQCDFKKQWDDLNGNTPVASSSNQMHQEN